jgi:uncharacterized SAM-binding protein YcdF (DUF218 family)
MRAPSISRKWVVVLNGGYTADERLPVTSRLSDTSLVRLVEGIRIHQQLPGSTLIVSVVGQTGPRSQGECTSRLGAALGVAASDLTMIEGARDTEEELNALHERLGSQPFVLVTSASHLPRAIALARVRGLNPTPAPTDYRAKSEAWDQPKEFLPGAKHLDKSERAFYEYLGIAWAKVRRL